MKSVSKPAGHGNANVVVVMEKEILKKKKKITNSCYSGMLFNLTLISLKKIHNHFCKLKETSNFLFVSLEKLPLGTRGFYVKIGR